MNYIIVALMVVAVLSIVFNVVMVWYAKTTLLKIDTVYTASEEAVDIFSRMDSFKEHLQSVYDMPTFYGDETLKGLLDHSGQMIEFLKRYEKIYSFTQPDLEKQLAEVSAEIEVEEREEEAEE
tara:strand:- start:323 stop:691 length:369 start_codon:yes stop_codon:yes gene_type:complete